MPTDYYSYLSSKAPLPDPTRIRATVDALRMPMPQRRPPQRDGDIGKNLGKVAAKIAKKYFGKDGVTGAEATKILTSDAAYTGVPAPATAAAEGVAYPSGTTAALSGAPAQGAVAGGSSAAGAQTAAGLGWGPGATAGTAAAVLAMPFVLRELGAKDWFGKGKPWSSLTPDEREKEIDRRAIQMSQDRPGRLSPHERSRSLEAIKERLRRNVELMVSQGR